MKEVRKKIESELPRYAVNKPEGSELTVDDVMAVYAEVIKLLETEIDKLIILPAKSTAKELSYTYGNLSVEAKVEGGLLSESFQMHMENNPGQRRNLDLFGDNWIQVGIVFVDATLVVYRDCCVLPTLSNEHRKNALNIIRGLDIPKFVFDKAAAVLPRSKIVFDKKFAEMKAKGYKTYEEKARDRERTFAKKRLESNLSSCRTLKVDVDLIRELLCRTGCLKEAPVMGKVQGYEDFNLANSVVREVTALGYSPEEVINMLDTYMLKSIVYL